MNTSVMSQESLQRATSSASTMNYHSIFEGFTAKGIPIEDIKPRENVFTFWAWQALGRRVRKGEHGVKACTFVPVNGKRETNEDTGEIKRGAGYRIPRTTTVFHFSQTEPIDGSKQDTPILQPVTDSAPVHSAPGPCKVCGFGTIANGICSFCG